MALLKVEGAQKQRRLSPTPSSCSSGTAGGLWLLLSFIVRRRRRRRPRRLRRCPFLGGMLRSCRSQEESTSRTAGCRRVKVPASPSKFVEAILWSIFGPLATRLPFGTNLEEC